jgi:signal transduction histidine kinase
MNYTRLDARRQEEVSMVNNAEDGLLAMVSHELRTPLVGVAIRTIERSTSG